MKKAKVIRMESDALYFDNGICLSSYHEQDCCEHHYLSFRDLTMADFEGLEFNLLTPDFFERIEGYGIALKPLVGHPVRVPGYGSNNGYYSSNLELCLNDGKNFDVVYNITECQSISD